jgi:hypothetical protein
MVVNQYASPVPPLFDDIFNYDNHWEVSASGGVYSASILNGEYLLRQNTSTHNIKSISPLGNIQVPYSAEVYARRPTGADTGTRYGLLFDWADTLHYYRFIVEPGSGTFQLQKYASGFVTLDSGSLPSGFSSAGATLKIERDGGGIRAYINGTLVAEASDTTYAHGRVGLMVSTPLANMASGNYAETAFDNFLVYELSALYRTLFERGPSVNAWEISASGGGYSASVLNGEYLLRQNTATHNIKSISPLGNIQVPYSAEVYARRPTGADSGTRYGLLFDWTDTLHYYRFIVEPGSGTFQLQKYDSGFVTLDSGSLPSGFSSSGATLKIERDGGSIRAYINGTLVTEVSDTTYTHGRVGLVVITPIDMVSGNYAEAAFDNFTIKELP